MKKLILGIMLLLTTLTFSEEYVGRVIGLYGNNSGPFLICISNNGFRNIELHSVEAIDIKTIDIYKNGFMGLHVYRTKEATFTSLAKYRLVEE